MLLVQFLFPLVTDAETDKSAGRAQRDRETRDLTDSAPERGEETHRLPDLRQPATARSRSTYPRVVVAKSTRIFRSNARRVVLVLSLLSEPIQNDVLVQ